MDDDKGMVTEVGTVAGWRLQAITDALGSHVVASKAGEETKLSPTADHPLAVALAKRVATEGMGVCQWERPVQTMGEFFMTIVANDFKKKG